MYNLYVKLCLFVFEKLKNKDVYYAC